MDKFVNPTLKGIIVSRDTILVKQLNEVGVFSLIEHPHEGPLLIDFGEELSEIDHLEIAIDHPGVNLLIFFLFYRGCNNGCLS